MNSFETIKELFLDKFQITLVYSTPNGTYSELESPNYQNSNRATLVYFDSKDKLRMHMNIAYEA